MVKTKKNFFNIAFFTALLLVISLAALSLFKAPTMAVCAEESFSAAWDATTSGYTHDTAVSDITLGDGKVISGKFAQGTASVEPKYYEATQGDSSTGTVRLYGGGTLTLQVKNDSYRINSIVLTFGASDKTNLISSDVGVFDTNTWTGKSDKVVLTINGTSGHRRIQSVTVSYAGHTHDVKETHEQVNPTCLQNGYKTHYECDCGVFFEDEDCTIEIGNAEALAAWKLDSEGGLLAATGHIYTGEITYVWDDTTYQCTATRYCDYDCGDFLTETVQGIYVKDSYANCDENEKGHYKATFMTPGFGVKETAANSYEVENSKLNHPNRRIEYSWNDETHECTASLYCNICLEKLDSETVLGVYVKDTGATVLENEKGHYKVTFERLSTEIKTTEKNSVIVENTKLTPETKDETEKESENDTESTKLVLLAVAGLAGLTVIMVITVICLIGSVAGLKRKLVSAPVENEVAIKKETKVAKKEVKQKQTVSENNNVMEQPSNKKGTDAKLEKIQQVLDSLKPNENKEPQTVQEQIDRAKNIMADIKSDNKLDNK